MPYEVLKRDDKKVAKSENYKAPTLTEIKKNSIVELALYDKSLKVPERCWAKITYRKGDQLKATIDDFLFHGDLFGLKNGDKLDITKKEVLSIWNKGDQ